VYEGHYNEITIALKASQWTVACIICRADNRFLNMKMRINVEMIHTWKCRMFLLIVGNTHSHNRNSPK